MKLSLTSLAIGGFGIGMTEFVAMGVLPDIAKTISISIPEAGHLISAYALGVVIGAPVLVAFASKYPPKKILMGLMLLFAVSNALSAIAPNYFLLFIARLLSGLPHGAFFGVGAVAAGRIAEKGKEAQAMSMMFAGLTVANIIGVPLGTYIGHNLSWRITFAGVAFIGIIAAVSIKFWFPNLASTKNSRVMDDLKIFKRLTIWLIIGITAIGTGGLFAWFSYIVPLLTEVSGFSGNAVTLILMVAGAGMSVGNIVGARLADRFSPLHASRWLLLGMTFSLMLIPFASHWQVSSVLVTFLTGAVAFSLIAPIQMLMIKESRGGEMLAAAFSQAAFNIGNALGAYLGGLPLEAGYDYTSPQWVGAGLAFCGFAISLVFAFKKDTRPSAMLAE